jgi:endogenous inhibitor of DNA gyrase (YacG/DUF329 family)
MKPLRIAACPRCGNSASLEPTNDWRPFCSERCKLIDLGAWFAEQHVIAADPDPETDDDSGELH